MTQHDRDRILRALGCDPEVMRLRLLLWRAFTEGNPAYQRPETGDTTEGESDG